MSLKHGLIGLLAREGPQTGYQLTKAFDRSVNFVWHAVHGQIYPELARLVEAGFIRQTGTGPRAPNGTRRHRRASPSCAGGSRTSSRRAALAARRSCGRSSSISVDPEAAEAFFRREAEEYRRELAVLEGFAAERVTKRSERASALTVDSGIRVLKARIKWAESAADEASGW